jgi:hypothetical protein
MRVGVAVVMHIAGQTVVAMASSTVPGVMGFYCYPKVTMYMLHMRTAHTSCSHASMRISYSCCASRSHCSFVVLNPQPVVAVPGCRFGLAICAVPPTEEDKAVVPGAYNCNTGHYKCEGMDVVETGTSTINMLHDLANTSRSRSRLDSCDADNYDACPVLQCHHLQHILTVRIL